MSDSTANTLLTSGVRSAVLGRYRWPGATRRSVQVTLGVIWLVDPPTARSYFNALRARIGHTQPVSGLAALGLPGYEKTTGRVIFLKGNMTLHVDATGVPHKVGPQDTSRLDLAYTVATDVLACWTEK